MILTQTYDDQMGQPIPAMARRTDTRLEQEHLDKVSTDRTPAPGPRCNEAARILQHSLVTEDKLPALEVTNIKDSKLREPRDDKTAGVKRDIGAPVCGEGDE